MGLLLTVVTDSYDYRNRIGCGCTTGLDHDGHALVECDERLEQSLKRNSVQFVVPDGGDLRLRDTQALSRGDLAHLLCIEQPIDLGGEQILRRGICAPCKSKIAA